MSKFQNSIHRVCLLLDTLFFQGFYKFLYLWSNYIDIIIPSNSIKLLPLHFIKSYLKSMRNIVQQNKLAISYPLPILMQVLLNGLILKES